MSDWSAESAVGAGEPSGRVPCKSWVLEQLCALQEPAAAEGCLCRGSWVASHEDQQQNPFPAAASLRQSL